MTTIDWIICIGCFYIWLLILIDIIDELKQSKK